jgi:dTDP-4-dehydrorhamnose 3,5-epimerase
MQLVKTRLPGVLIVEPQAFADERGWFMETFNEARWHSALRELGEPIPRPFVQDNHSCSRAGVLRGLHYQLKPHAQGKLVRVVSGAAFDVAVDLRRESGTFGQWFGIELSADNRRQMWIPEGFGHGFLSLADNTHFLYKTTDVYNKSCERAIRWDDAEIGINWPEVSGSAAISVSDKDQQAPALREAGLDP